ncbi:hypothetical protein CCACVL1_14424 [Corchorus capsularis]|uniref:Uncharacterized protein n=1 Tax=Corchorus capsularis TaxID=210143 RepID=A0A1R3I723_COCAP|nr:hypothetical protein CCACVL1_14424 [Corchorus capsularis]
MEATIDPLSLIPPTIAKVARMGQAVEEGAKNRHAPWRRREV